MYGFKKVISADSGGLKGEKEEQEFSHPLFIHGQEHLLELIKRKASNTASRNYQEFRPGTERVNHTEKVNQLLTEVEYVKNRQTDMDGRINIMKNENDALWGEVMNLRLKYSQQQKTVNKLIHFLSAVVQPNGRKRLFPEIGGGQISLQDRRQEVKKIKLGEDNLTGGNPFEMGETVSFQEVLGGNYHQEGGSEILYHEVVQDDTPENEGQVAVVDGDKDLQTILINEQTSSNVGLITKNLNIDMKNIEMDLDNQKDDLSGHILVDSNFESNLFNKDADFSTVNLEECVADDSPLLSITGTGFPPGWP